MAKRFGRNQRRHARESLQSARATISTMQLQQDRLSKEVRTLVEVMGDIQDLMRHSIALDARECKEIPTMPARTEEFNLAVERRGLAFSDFETSIPFLSLVERVHRMHVLVMEAADADVMGQLHIRFALAGGRVGYAISRDALLRTPPRMLAERLGHEMAAALLRTLTFEKLSGEAR